MKKQKRQQLPRSISPKRMRLFRIIALSIPILVFIILEFSLRFYQYGPDLSLFNIETINGRPYYTLNPSIKNRYFGRINFSPDPSPEYFLVSKPPGTYRIFCLGESTTVGYPYWYNGAFASFLRDRLQAVFPDRSIEVINLGITATNSYTVLDISKDLMDYGPDLLIVYDGHNDFYGVLGAASNDRVAPTRWMTQLYLRMIHLRTFQLAKNITAEILGLFGKTPVNYSSRTTMMEQVARGKTIPYDNDVYQKGFAVFQENLKELSNRCQSHHLPLILSTQVSNIREQPPFISNNSFGISEEQRSQFQQIYRNGLDLQSKGLLDSAIVRVHSCIAIDSLYADAHYRLAQCYEAKGKKQEAYSEYILARDYDELRFRTDSKFNNLIRSMEGHGQTIIADIETLFKSLSPDSLIGRNLILEHLHPNSRGHFFIAKAYARLMRSHGLLASSEEWAKKDTITDNFLWEHRHVTDVDEFLALRKAEFLTSGWPFKNKSSVIATVETTDTLRYIADEAARNQIGWDNAHRSAAEYYLQHGDFASAGREYETILNQFPLDVDNYLTLAQFYKRQKDLSNAEIVLLASVHIQQTSLAYRLLGEIYLIQGRPEKAIPYYEELIKFPDSPALSSENAYMLAVAYLLAKKIEPAMRILEQTIDRYPGYKPARELLARARLIAKTHPEQ